MVRYRAVRREVPAHGVPLLPHARPPRSPAPVDIGYTLGVDDLHRSPALVGVSKSVRDLAVGLLVQAGQASRDSNHRRLRLLAGLLVHDQSLHGGLDACRALTRDSIDAYLGTLEPRYAKTTIACYSSDLRHFSRALYPQAYPNALRQREGKGVMPLRHSPCTQAEVDRLWRDTRQLNPRLASNGRVVIAAAAGAGARAQEIAQIRARDVLTLPGPGGQEITYLDLTCLSRGERRIVPVLQDRFASFLRSASRHVDPSAHLLDYSVGQSGGVSNTVARMRAAGLQTDVNAVRMRHFFVLELLKSGVPTAAVMQLADVGDSHLLARLRPFMPEYSARELAELMTTARVDS